MITFTRTVVLASALLPAGAGAAADVALPTVEGQEAVATVNGEPITVEDLFAQIGSMHAGVDVPEAMVRKPDPSKLLERLINVRLVLQEAENIGLHELPEMTRQFELARLDLLKEAVIRERVQGITAGDPEVVERIFRDSVREIRIESVLLPSEEEAAAFLSELEAGAEFDAVARARLAEGRALAHQPPEYLRASQLQPEVASVIGRLEPGSLSRPIGLPAGITVLRVLDVRYPEDAEARADAEQQALQRRRQIALGEYAVELRKRYAKVDEALLATLDYDAPDRDLDALREDARVVARIEDGTPITVSQLTARMESKMFHGLDRAAEQQRANDEVPGTLDRLIQERAVVLEAKRLGIDERPEFRRSLQARYDGMLFGKFVSKVIDPMVKLEDGELRTYHAEHREEYASPEMMRLESLVFGRREDAQAALDKLRRGADLKWMRANASGQVDPQAVAPDWRFAGALLPTTELPENARDALAGAATDDYRFCEQPGGGPFHVLRVIEAFPSRPMEYEAVKKQIAVLVFSRKRQEVLEDWMARLRQASDVQVFVDVEQIRTLLGLDGAEGA